MSFDRTGLNRADRQIATSSLREVIKDTLLVRYEGSVTTYGGIGIPCSRAYIISHIVL